MYIWGKEWAADRVGPDFLSEIAGRVGSTFRRVGSGRVQKKWPLDNFEATFHRAIISQSVSTNIIYCVEAILSFQ